MKTIPIIFYPGWNESINAYLTRISNQTPNGKGEWGLIKGETDPNICKYAICQDGIVSIEKALADGFSKNQIIYIKRESNLVMPEINESVALTYQGENILIPSIWWISTTFNELALQKYPVKTKNISSVVSNLSNLEGHRDRLEFINKLSEVIDIDVFGKGHNKNSFFGKYQGEIRENGRCKLSGLAQYRYSVAIENASMNGYVTEKFNDCILSWAIPIYFGAPNVSTYFPKRSFSSIKNLKSNLDVLNVAELSEIDVSKDDINYLSQARELILFTYNLWNIVSRLVENLEF